jgi:hypothetical protein
LVTAEATSIAPLTRFALAFPYTIDKSKLLAFMGY